MVLQWGICTAGKISFDFCNALGCAPDRHKVVAVAARDLQRAKEFADKFGVPSAYSNYAELVSDPQVHVIYIGSVNVAHFEQSIMFLKSKKPVVCEKPLAMNLKEADMMVKVAREQKTFLVEAIWSRWFPVYRRIRDAIDMGEIGTVRLVQANFQVHVGGTKSLDQIWSPKLGGSTCLYIGTYIINFAFFVFKEYPMKIDASGGLFENGVDEYLNLTFHYTGNRVAFLNVHGTCPGSTSAHIIGTEGRIDLPQSFWCPSEMSINSSHVEFPLPTGYKYDFVYPNSSGLLYEADHVKDCLAQGFQESPDYKLQEMLENRRCHDEILRQVGVIYSKKS